MSSFPAALVDAWVAAGRDLDVNVVPRFDLGDLGTFAALVEGFGSPRGTVVSWLGAAHRVGDAGEHGYFVSVLNPEAYAEYDRSLFLETLIDWGWHSDAPPPNWYADATSGRG